MMDEDNGPEYVSAFSEMSRGQEVQSGILEKFVCRLYGIQNCDKVNDARRQKLYSMAYCKETGKKFGKIKKVNCALLPPCQKVLEQKIKRAQYIGNIWSTAHSAEPGGDKVPSNYGWTWKDGKWKPIWYDGDALPQSLNENESVGGTASDHSDGDGSIREGQDEAEDEEWSDVSDEEEFE